MMNDESKSPDPDSRRDEFDQFEHLLKRVIAVPKTEIDAARKAEKQKPPPRKTA
jgi:hypothetical protein